MSKVQEMGYKLDTGSRLKAASRLTQKAAGSTTRGCVGQLFAERQTFKRRDRVFKRNHTHRGYTHTLNLCSQGGSVAPLAIQHPPLPLYLSPPPLLPAEVFFHLHLLQRYAADRHLLLQLSTFPPRPVSGR